jgi:hypothetical protein
LEDIIQRPSDENEIDSKDIVVEMGHV